MRSIRGLYVVRGGGPAPALTARATRATVDGDATGDAPTDGRLGTLVLDFAPFDQWYRIDSWWEGTFMERVVKGAFKRTIRNNGDQVKCLFNHGFDFHIGDKILGVQEVLEERDAGPHMEVPLLDTSYNRDLEPGLRAGGYGASFMFEVLGEKWDREPEKSEHNPDGLPERSLTEVRLFEDGPVTWPANPTATSALRSGTDWLVEQLQLRDVDRKAQLVADLDAFRARYGLRTPSRMDGPATPPTVPDPAPPKTPAPGDPVRHVNGTPAARAARLRALQLANRRRENAAAYESAND